MSPARLRECLQALSWSQRGLARLLGRSETSVRQWTRGTVAVPAEVARWLEIRAAHAERTRPPVKPQP